MQQRYMLTIWDLFTMSGSDVSGGEAVIAIMDGDQEIGRITISGKCQSQDGYRRSYTGKPGLSARVIAGPGTVALQSIQGIDSRDEIVGSDGVRPVAHLMSFT